MDAGQIKLLLAARAEEFAIQLLPGARRNGNKLLAGSIAGEAGKSLVVTLDGQYAGGWMDHAATECHGDLIDLWRFTRGCSMGDAIRGCAEWLNVEHHVPSGPRARPIAPRKELLPPTESWLKFQGRLRKGSISELDTVARIRKLSSYAGLELASRAGQLWFADVKDDGFEWPAWILTDDDRINAQARRMDGKPWSSGNYKSKTIYGISGVNASWPIGLANTSNKEIAFVEGGPDLLAAWHLIWATERTRDISPVFMAGTAHKIPDAALPRFAGKIIWLYADADAAGAKAAQFWSEQLRGVGCTVHHNPLSLDGAKDLNEALSEVSM